MSPLQKYSNSPPGREAVIIKLSQFSNHKKHYLLNKICPKGSQKCRCLHNQISRNKRRYYQENNKNGLRIESTFSNLNLTHTTKKGSRVSHHEVVSRERCSVSSLGDPLMSCTPLPKAAKPVWASQLTRLPRRLA